MLTDTNGKHANKCIELPEGLNCLTLARLVIDVLKRKAKEVDDDNDRQTLMRAVSILLMSDEGIEAKRQKKTKVDAQKKEAKEETKDAFVDSDNTCNEIKKSPPCSSGDDVPFNDGHGIKDSCKKALQVSADAHGEKNKKTQNDNKSIGAAVKLGTPNKNEVADRSQQFYDKPLVKGKSKPIPIPLERDIKDSPCDDPRVKHGKLWNQVRRYVELRAAISFSVCLSTLSDTLEGCRSELEVGSQDLCSKETCDRSSPQKNPELQESGDNNEMRKDVKVQQTLATSSVSNVPKSTSNQQVGGEVLYNGSTVFKTPENSDDTVASGGTEMEIQTGKTLTPMLTASNWAKDGNSSLNQICFVEEALRCGNMLSQSAFKRSSTSDKKSTFGSNLARVGMELDMELERRGLEERHSHVRVPVEQNNIALCKRPSSDSLPLDSQSSLPYPFPQKPLVATSVYPPLPTSLLPPLPTSPPPSLPPLPPSPPPSQQQLQIQVVTTQHRSPNQPVMYSSPVQEQPNTVLGQVYNGNAQCHNQSQMIWWNGNYHQQQVYNPYQQYTVYNQLQMMQQNIATCNRMQTPASVWPRPPGF